MKGYPDELPERVVPTRDARGAAAVLLACGALIPILAWLERLAVGGLLIAVALGATLASFGWSFRQVPRWLGPSECRMWTTFGWRSFRVRAGSDVEVSSQSGPHFYGEIASIAVVTRWRGERRIRLRCTLSSDPQEAACARLDIERDRRAARSVA
jgi:hypothetical protein